MIIYLLSILLGLFGLTIHWLKRWLRFQERDNFIDYLKVNPKHTIGSILSVVGSISIVASSGIDLMDSQTLGTLVMTGYTIDSMVNKGSE